MDNKHHIYKPEDLVELIHFTSSIEKRFSTQHFGKYAANGPNVNGI